MSRTKITLTNQLETQLGINLRVNHQGDGAETMSTLRE